MGSLMTNAPLYFWHASQNLDILFVSCVFVSLFSIIAIFLCLHSDLSWICPQSYNNFPIYASFSRVLLNLLIKSPTALLSDRFTVRPICCPTDLPTSAKNPSSFLQGHSPQQGVFLYSCSLSLTRFMGFLQRIPFPILYRSDSTKCGRLSDSRKTVS